MPDPLQAHPPSAQCPVWRVLDTDFGQGQHFLSTWQGWLRSSQAQQRLHYVGLLVQAPQDFGAQLLAAARQTPGLAELAQELTTHVWGLLPGFHRIELGQGRVTLTLCVGALQPLLHAQAFFADEVRLGESTASPPTPVWDRWSAKALARLCQRGTRVVYSQLQPEERAALTQAGFDLAHATYAPRWELRRTRQPARAWAGVPGRCAVIGAGLAGASTAAALARRGWQVDVYDAAAMPASGASGLPVGLLVPHVSADDSLRSRLSRAGVRTTLQHARALLQAGQDWCESGVLEHRIDKSAGLPLHENHAGHGLDWSRVTPIAPDSSWSRGMATGVTSLWHAHAGWIKPAALVAAWLRQPGVRFMGQCAVGAIEREDESWDLQDKVNGTSLGQAQLVVLANAGGVWPLLLQAREQQLIEQLPIPPLQGLRGVLSWGRHADLSNAPDWPPYPVNGLGAFIPAVPSYVADMAGVQGGREVRWYAGATYEDVEHPTPQTAHHARNFEKLRTLLPTCAQAWQGAFASGQVQAWQGVRWTTADRMPWVGPLTPGNAPSLWICAGMGSRGLSLAALCGELLASQISGEPMPVERDLAARLDVARHLGPA